MDQRTNFLALILLDALEDENDSDVYSILERNCVDPSFVPIERGISPLHYSCGMDNVRLATDITKRFLDAGADPNVRSNENMTPLHVAAIYGRVEIVSQLLQHGAHLDVFDDERKTPVHYAIEECHFEVVQLMRDHIFLHKYERKQQQQTNGLNNCPQNAKLAMISHTKIDNKQSSTPKHVNEEYKKNPTISTDKDKLYVSHISDAVEDKYTPKRINYNYDVTSPYYINITHRRHQPQPKFPDIVNCHNIVQSNMSTTVGNEKSPAAASVDTTTEPINIFTLTKENLKELSQNTPNPECSRLSLIETWREKVQRSRARQSILKQFDDIGEMVDTVMKNDHLNFTNTVLNERIKDETAFRLGESTSASLVDATEYALLPSPKEKTMKCTLSNMSLGKIIQSIAQAHQVDVSEQEPEAESSYQTVPEIPMEIDKTKSPLLQVPKEKHQQETGNEHDDTYTTKIIRSPSNNEYFLQMAEAYVHTDDENGLVFYETKLLSNQGNKMAQQRNAPTNRTPTAGAQNLNTTATTQSTNFTLPLDYETDALREELTTFGEPPGPITKSTKRLYIKRLVKYKRKTANVMGSKNMTQGTKEPIELYRTVRSIEIFQRITDYLKYEAQSMTYFAQHQDKKKMREGHLKQSFIYMLIDPRISCNLPGESVFLEKYEIWKRFLESIFYVGKGKTSRPYSHLYDAMKAHSRMHNIRLNNEVNKNGKKISIKKQPLNVELFKLPPAKSSESKKLDRILNIWGNGNGVVCLHVFHNIVPAEAYTREAAMIDALSLQHLTNAKRGDYYGPAQTWTMKEKKYLGIILLFKAMQIYLAEGESQLSPSDLI